jgi:hypothetical protein
MTPVKHHHAWVHSHCEQCMSSFVTSCLNSSLSYNEIDNREQRGQMAASADATRVSGRVQVYLIGRETQEEMAFAHSPTLLFRVVFATGGYLRWGRTGPKWGWFACIGEMDRMLGRELKVS